VLGGTGYSFFKYQMHRAAEAVLSVHDAVTGEFCHRFGRCYGAVDAYRLDDAEWVIVMSNSFSTVGKDEVARLRARGEKVGLLRLRLIRPFPAHELEWLLGGRRAVAVIDQNISIGKGGILFGEVASALRGRPAESDGGPPEPMLLYSDSEYRQVTEMLRIAQHGAYNRWSD
jgi:pyruvate ferredoxin oxidoreductase alpha subunit